MADRRSIRTASHRTSSRRSQHWDILSKAAAEAQAKAVATKARLASFDEKLKTKMQIEKLGIEKEVAAVIAEAKSLEAAANRPRRAPRHTPAAKDGPTGSGHNIPTKDLTTPLPATKAALLCYFRTRTSPELQTPEERPGTMHGGETGLRASLAVFNSHSRQAWRPHRGHDLPRPVNLAHSNHDDSSYTAPPEPSDRRT